MIPLPLTFLLFDDPDMSVTINLTAEETRILQHSIFMDDTIMLDFLMIEDYLHESMEIEYEEDGPDYKDIVQRYSIEKDFIFFEPRELLLDPLDAVQCKPYIFSYINGKYSCNKYLNSNQLRNTDYPPLEISEYIIMQDFIQNPKSELVFSTELIREFLDTQLDIKMNYQEIHNLIFDEFNINDEELSAYKEVSSFYMFEYIRKALECAGLNKNWINTATFSYGEDGCDFGDGQYDGLLYIHVDFNFPTNDNVEIMNFNNKKSQK